MEKNTTEDLSVSCAVCGEAIRLIHYDEAGWTGVCLDGNCQAVHQGHF